MKPVYILALHGVRTGGPECTHQLSDALLQQGFDARMVYFEFGDFIASFRTESGEDCYRWCLAARETPAGDVLVLPEKKGPRFSEYARYRVRPATEIEPGSIVVLPETLVHMAPYFAGHTLLVWWLSVDFAFKVEVSLRDSAGRIAHVVRGGLSEVVMNRLRHPHVHHAYQSRYARSFIEAMQFPCIGPLTDYTADLREYAQPRAEREPLALFTVRADKVFYDMDALMSRVEEIEPAAICKAFPHALSRPQLADAFSQARVYVDFGIFAGKDRMPREAAIMGCDVVVGARGAGAVDYAEWGFALADPDDTESAAQLIAERVRSPQPCRMRDPHIKEKAQLFAEARAVFSKLGAAHANG